MLSSHVRPSILGRGGGGGGGGGGDVIIGMLTIFGEGRGGEFRSLWGLLVIKGHPCQNEASVVSSFASGGVTGMG